MSLDRVTVGFIPLVDAALPIIAEELGFASEEGIEIELMREISWANIRDRLALGHYDAAHLLAPLAIATSLGLSAIRTRLAAPMTLGLNGNAVTLAPAFFEELEGHLAPGADPTDPRASAAALRALVEARRAAGDQPPTLGMTFPFSSHNYQLRLWIAAGGLDPDRDVRLAVVPPPFMVDALEQGHVEGFCVGAPWNSVAVEQGIGRILHLGVDFVRRSPEKVLAMRADRIEERGDVAARLVRACCAAADWIERPENRQEAAERMSARSRLDIPAAIIRRALDGRLPTGAADESRLCGTYITFARDALRPEPAHARWLHGEMVRWGQAASDRLDEAVAVYRPDLFDKATGMGSGQSPDDPLGLVIA